MHTFTHTPEKDLVRTRQALDKYCNMDMSFENTREYKFLVVRISLRIHKVAVTVACDTHMDFFLPW